MAIAALRKESTITDEIETADAIRAAAIAEPERLHYQPAKIVVTVFVTPSYACPKKRGSVE